MSIFSALLELRTSLADPAKWLEEWFAGGTATTAGVTVSETTALNLSSVFACAYALSSDVAKLSLLVYRRLPQGGKTRAADHPVYRLLHSQPNPEMSAMDFRQVMTLYLVLWGNAYAEIQIDRRGRPWALWPLLPWEVQPARSADRQLWYEVREATGAPRMVEASRMLHVRGLSLDGIVGCSVVRMARETIGLGMAAEQYGASFFGNGAMPGGVLEHPGRLSPGAKDKIAESWNKIHQGASAAKRVAVLEEGMKYNAVSIPPEDAQFLQTREFQVEEVCRWFRMPPSKIGQLRRAQGWSTLEVTNTDYLIDTLMPWLLRWEQWCNVRLFSPAEQPEYFAEHLVESILRADSQTRSQANAVAVQWGWLTRNEVREMENRNPLPGLDEPLTPLNMAKDGQEPGTDQRPSQGRGEGGDGGDDDVDDRARVLAAIARAHMPVLVDALGRMLRKEGRAARAAAKRPQEFPAWLDEYYGRHAPIVAEAIRPCLEAYDGAVRASLKVEPAAADWDALARALAERHCQESRTALLGCLQPDQDLVWAVDGLAELWETQRAAQEAARELEREQARICP